METILGFFADLILFTAGLAVLTFWFLIIIIVVDELIDIVLPNRKNSEEE